jgi:hypothetical protein
MISRGSSLACECYGSARHLKKPNHGVTLLPHMPSHSHRVPRVRLLALLGSKHHFSVKLKVFALLSLEWWRIPIGFNSPSVEHHGVEVCGGCDFSGANFLGADISRFLDFYQAIFLNTTMPDGSIA